jgi:hypothetical protein
MELMEQDTKDTVSNKVKTYEEGTVLAFLKAHLEGPLGSEASIKTVVPARYYRINFFKSTWGKDCLLPHVSIVDSRFIEVIHSPNGLKIVRLD